MSGKRQGELPQKIPGSKNNNKKQKGNNDEDEPASDPDISRSDNKDESASDPDIPRSDNKDESASDPNIPKSDNEDEPASDPDISSEEEEDLNGRDEDGDGETIQEKRNRQINKLLSEGKDYHLTHEIRRHKFEDVDGCIEFRTISIHRYKKAKEAQKKLIKKLKSKFLDKSTPDGDKKIAKEQLREAKDGLEELEEIVQDVKDSNDDFMFLSKSSNFSLNQKLKERFERVILFSNCAFLPSPEVVKGGRDEGSDKTGTLQDFQTVFKWAEKLKICEKEESFESGSKMVDEQSYNDLIKFAFNTGYELMRNTIIPTTKELMFYYYAGHGLDTKKVENPYSAAPVLEKNDVLPKNYFKDASPYISKNREVKGGELCLHKYGFCDFEGLVEPFIAAIKSESIYSSGEKKNKHLIIVLDSCHSGQFAEDLTKFKDQQGQGWLNEGCSVTVQASCGKDETVVGGYFTPTFIFLNDPKNESVLKKLLGDWDKMKEEEKKKCRDQLAFPSPVLSSTRNLPDSPILQVWVLIENQDFHMTLFKDAGFFKYCYCKIFGPLELQETPNLGNSRVLTQTLASEFLRKKKFEVIDFKLKTNSTAGPFVGEKLGLFLLDDPDVPNQAICAHVHFAERGTSKVHRINLLHHRNNPNSLPLFDYQEDHIGLSSIQFYNKIYKIPIAMVPNCEKAKENNPNHWVAWKWKTMNEDQSFRDLAEAETSSGFDVTDNLLLEVEYAMELVTKCHQFVVSKEMKDKPLWSDPTQWYQTSSQLRLFREKQRSVLMEKYFEQIKGYNLPKVQ